MLTLLLAVLILPADTVTGRVVDNAGQPVPQAIVEITQLGKSVMAGADGAFRVALAPGRYTLAVRRHGFAPAVREIAVGAGQPALEIDRKSTRLNSSHQIISYAVFCLKKK